MVVRYGDYASGKGICCLGVRNIFAHVWDGTFNTSTYNKRKRQGDRNREREIEKQIREGTHPAGSNMALSILLLKRIYIRDRKICNNDQILS